jgi:leader peptidase (prepilin peptidase)/N-methyltransferase
LIRWPKDETMLGPGSRCDSCGTAIAPYDLFPLVSHLLLRGRCRACGAAIDRRHLAMELAAALIGAVAFLAHPLPLAFVTALFGWWLLLVAALDREHFWLPDRLTVPLALLGLLVGWAGFGPTFTDRLFGLVLGQGVLASIAWLYKRLRGRDGMGGGDPKLMGAVGAWVGMWNLPAILLGAGLLGLAAMLAMRLRGEAVDRTTRLPLGTLIALAAWPVWLLVAAPNLTP